MAHSSIVGGSTADRLLSCPGSFQAILALPPAAEKPSEYALEGSSMHAVMDNLLRLRKEAPDLDTEGAVGGKKFDLIYEGQLASISNTRPLFAALVKGITSSISDSGGKDVNIVHAKNLIAKKKGMYSSMKPILEKPPTLLMLVWLLYALKPATMSRLYQDTFLASPSIYLSWTGSAHPLCLQGHC